MEHSNDAHYSPKSYFENPVSSKTQCETDGQTMDLSFVCLYGMILHWWRDRIHCVSIRCERFCSIWMSVNREYKYMIHLKLSCEQSFYLHSLIPIPAQDQNPKPLLIETQRCYKRRLLFLSHLHSHLSWHSSCTLHRSRSSRCSCPS